MCGTHPGIKAIANEVILLIEFISEVCTENIGRDDNAQANANVKAVVGLFPKELIVNDAQ